MTSHSPARTLTILLILAGAVVLGAVTARLGGLPVKNLTLVALVVCGAAGALIWVALRLPIVPCLRVLLLACLAFRLEINLFPVFKYNEGMPGLNVSLMLLTSLALGCAHLAARWHGQAARRIWPLGFGFWALALLLWCLLGALASTEQLLAFYGCWSLATCLFFAFIIANEFGQREHLRQAVFILAAMIGVNGVIGVLQATTGAFRDLAWLGAAKLENLQAFGDGEIARATGLHEMANAFAWFLVTLLPVLVAVLLARVPDFSAWQRRGLLGAAAAGTLALLLTYARGSWIAFGVALSVVVALTYRSFAYYERKRFRRQLAALAVVGFICCLPFAKAIYVRLTEDDNGSAYSRVPLSQVAQTMIAANPLLGVGLANYEAEMRRYDHTPERISEDFPWPVHNIFLHSTAEAGLPGLFFFLALIACALWQGARALSCPDRLLRALAAGLLAGTLAYFVTGLKELGSLGTGQMRLCFLSCGLLLALGRAAAHYRNRSY